MNVACQKCFTYSLSHFTPSHCQVLQESRDSIAGLLRQFDDLKGNIQ